MSMIRLFFKATSYCTIGALIILSIWWLFFSIDGTKAYINGSLTSISAPIDGTLSLRRLNPTDPVDESKELGSVGNPRAAQIELEYTRIRSDLVQLALKLDSMKTALSERQALLEDTLVRVKDETKLNVELVQGDIARATQELKGLEASARVANDKWRRVSDPKVQFALSKNELIEAQGIADSTSAMVTAKKAELTAHNSRLAAAKGGWDAQLRQRTQSFSEKIKLEREIKDLTRDISEGKLQSEQLTVQLKQAQEQLDLARAAPLVSPLPGCVWSIVRRDASILKAADVIVQILSPTDRWIEAFVAESQADELNIGDSAMITVPGKEGKFPAVIEAVRGGGGRVVAGQDVAYPPPERMRKEVAVRLRFTSHPPQFSNRDFYGVGRTVSVEFIGSGSLFGLFLGAQIKLRTIWEVLASSSQSLNMPESVWSFMSPILFLFVGMIVGMLLSSLRKSASKLRVAGSASTPLPQTKTSGEGAPIPSNLTKVLPKNREGDILRQCELLQLPERQFEVQNPLASSVVAPANSEQHHSKLVTCMHTQKGRQKPKSRRKPKGKGR